MLKNHLVLGIVEGIEIAPHVGPASFSTIDLVRLRADYVRNPPPSFPRCDAGAPATASLHLSPTTIPAGTVTALFRVEAEALVSAGAAERIAS